MAQTYTRTVQYTGDSNPNGDNYTWVDVNGAQAAGWIILTQQSGTDAWDFEVQDWVGGTGTRQAEFKIQHWLYTDDTDTTKWDSFLITQYALDGSVTTTEATTTEATTTGATTTLATTTAATTQAATTTQATTQPTYTVTVGANSSIANASVYNVASGGSPNNTLTRTGVAGSSFADAFYIEANPGYNISPSQVSITSWGGGGTNYYVDPNVNSAGRVVVGFSDQIDPNNLSIEIAFTGSVSQITYTAQVHENDDSSTICNQTTANNTFTYPQGQGGANFQNYFLNNYGVSGNSGWMKIISSNEPNFAWSGWAIGMNDDNESTGGWFNCANATTSSGGGSGSGGSGGGSGATTILPSSVNISGEEWIYTMGGPEDYTATVSNINNPTYSWSLTGLHQNKFLLTNETSQVCTLEFIWNTPCDGGGLDIDLNVSVTGTNSQGQTVTVGDVKGVNGCDDSGESESS